MHNLVPFQQEQSCLTNKQKSLSETLNQGHLRISWSIPPIPPTLVFCLLYFSSMFFSLFVFCISYRFVCCIFLPVREPYCSSSPSPTSFKWDPVCQEIEFEEEKAEAEPGVCVLLTTFVYGASPRTPARVVWRTRRPHPQHQRRQIGWSESQLKFFRAYN